MITFLFHNNQSYGKKLVSWLKEVFQWDCIASASNFSLSTVGWVLAFNDAMNVIQVSAYFVIPQMKIAIMLSVVIISICLIIKRLKNLKEPVETVHNTKTSSLFSQTFCHMFIELFISFFQHCNYFLQMVVFAILLLIKKKLVGRVNFVLWQWTIKCLVVQQMHCDQLNVDMFRMHYFSLWHHILQIKLKDHVEQY